MKIQITAFVEVENTDTADRLVDFISSEAIPWFEDGFVEATYVDWIPDNS